MDNKKMQEIYNAALENDQPATEAITVPYQRMCDEFRKYMDAIQEDSFWLGYRAAIKNMGG